MWSDKKHIFENKCACLPHFFKKAEHEKTKVKAYVNAVVCFGKNTLWDIQQIAGKKGPIDKTTIPRTPIAGQKDHFIHMTR